MQHVATDNTTEFHGYNRHVSRYCRHFMVECRASLLIGLGVPNITNNVKLSHVGFLCHLSRK